MCGISCHNNTKFLHAIAEVCLYLMHKKMEQLLVFGAVTCIWSLTPQLEILRSESLHLYSLHVHYKFTEPSEFVLSTLTQNLYLPV